jgi:hypothetical protein
LYIDVDPFLGYLNRLDAGRIPDVWNVNVSKLRIEAVNISETSETLPK